MTLVLCNGCFDPFHYGHLLHFYAARSHGTRLAVALTADRYVNKGPGRPFFTAEQRGAVLLALRGLVDEVIVSDAPRPDDLIRRLQPAVYAKGVEYAGRLPEQALVESYGGRVLFTETPKFSSSAVWHSIAPLDPVPWA